MDALDILKYGHDTLLQAIDGLPDSEWDTPGACGDLSTRALLIHMAAQENVLADVLSTFVPPGGPTPYFDRFRALQGGDAFTLEQIAAAPHGSPADARAAYLAAHARLLAHAAQIPPETLRAAGTIPWYGAEYALDDLIVYFNYGHKREHSGQLGLFRDRAAAPAGGG